MSKGLGSMQRAILTALDAKGGKSWTDDIMLAVGKAMMEQGRRVTIDLSTHQLGAEWCWREAFCVSFYRALNGLQRRGLVFWQKEHGGYKCPGGKVVRTTSGLTPREMAVIDEQPEATTKLPGTSCCGMWDRFYECPDCGMKFEMFQSNRAPVVCPQCEGRNLAIHHG